MKIDLNGKWIINSSSYKNITADIPGSVLSTLLDHKLIEDPYYRLNEYEIKKISYEDFDFERDFSLTKEQLENHNFLFFDGVDTIADIYINGFLIAKSLSMNIAQRILINPKILKEDNHIKIHFVSPYRYIKEYPFKEYFHTYSYNVTEEKSPVIRKANSMFGWDWGPNLGDMGIFRDIYILSTSIGHFEYFTHKQEFLKDNKVRIIVNVKYKKIEAAKITLRFYFKEKDILYSETKELHDNNEFVFIIDNPKLWWPNGFGEQNLYNIDFIINNDKEEQITNKRIGIRKIKIDDSIDKYGRNMAVYVNDEKVFIKGSNYIIQDIILNRVNYESVKRLLTLVKDFNHNTLRVWGGSYYPDDYFYDLCDEMGILIFQDMMFACALYDYDDLEFRSIVETETRHTIRRIKNHPCLLAFSGNNEIEISIENNNNEFDKIKYKDFFLDFLKRIVKEEIDIFYLSSSPTSEEPYFVNSMNPNILDVHDWSVWHGRKPFEYFKSIYPRFLSEFGTQSFPLMDTVNKYANKDDLYIESEVMEHHQKSKNNNPIIMRYISDLYPEPKTFEDIVYLSMLSQAEGIKMCAEHLRRHKDICNGMIYWQLNDCWPGQTWSSIDYYFGIKALHYYSKKFYSPNLISVDDEEEGKLKLSISNDTREDMNYIIKYNYYDFKGNLLSNDEFKCFVAKASNKYVRTIEDLFDRDDVLLFAQLFDVYGNLLSNTFYQKKKDKELHYQKPHLEIKRIDDYSFIVKVDYYSKGIYIEPHDNRCVLSDNYFNLLPSQEIVISSTNKIDFSKLEIRCLNEIIK